MADAPITQGRKLRLSAVIACYKDAEAVPHMHRRLTEVFSALDVDYEIIFVNDGSPDDTDRVLATLTANDDHVIAVEHSRNFGAQNAFLSGMELATGDGVVLLDGDLQDPPEVIPALFEKWRQGNDVVYARRATPRSMRDPCRRATTSPVEPNAKGGEFLEARSIPQQYLKGK